MLEQVLKTIQKYKMFEPREKVVVAVSGGPDSIALLHVLRALNARLCLKLYVAHLDHSLRKDSRKDLIFVKKAAEGLNIPFYGAVLDVRRIEKQASLEDALRKLRYNFILAACKKIRSKKIALGHTKDDQAETVLMRMLRGSGLHGLSAILPKRDLNGCQVVRPLIEVTKSDVLRYLAAHKVPFKLDLTNFEDRFMRNKIRNNLLPLLEKQYNPNIKEVLSNFALTVGVDYAYLDQKARLFLNANMTSGRAGCKIGLGELLKLDIALRRLAVRQSIESLQGHLKKITFKHWQEVDDLLEARPCGSQVHLPGFITVSKTKGCLNIFKR
ncbi:MAG: tRNA lysidine(34) synthetase TilS [Candidatus Omnitrophota bacterium]